MDILTPLGALYYNTGRYNEALQVYSEAAALQPHSTDIWLALVNTHTHTRNHGNCWPKKTDCTHTHKIDKLFVYQAQVLAMAGRSKEAEKMTLDIISRDSGCIECYRLLSAIYSKRGNYTQVRV